MINSLKENEVFVFGSNLNGHHGGGAAKQAYEQFGAEWGVGEGLTGQCYAFPTLDTHMEQCSVEELTKSVFKLIDCAKENPNKVFLLTKVVTGIAGRSEEFMRNIFNEELPSNIIKPEKG